MNLLEQQLDYSFGEQLPGNGTAIAVAPGVRWIRMALPFALDHINLWLLRDEMDDPALPGHKLQGWTVVDCCISAAESKAQWETIFATQLEGMPILRVIVTHMHPDHIGLAAWLCERWSRDSPALALDAAAKAASAGPPQARPAPSGGSAVREATSVGAFVCQLWISATDFHAARNASQGNNAFGGDAAARFFASHGMTDEESLAKIRGRSGYYPSMVPGVPASFCRLVDGMAVAIGSGTDRKTWRCISGYGHAPEHMALYCEGLGLLISGDMVLPRISTNVSVYDLEPEADALGLFLSSIARYLSLPADTLTLPSHGKPFRGLHTRITQLQDHHRDRLAEVQEACAKAPCSAADILPVMFKRKLDLHQTTFAMGEALAHLHRLWLAGDLLRSLDVDAIYRFSQPPGFAAKP